LAKVCLAHRSPRWPSKSSCAEMIGFTAIYATKHDPLIVIFRVFLSLPGQILCGWFHMAGSHGHRVFEAPGHCTPSCQGIPAEVEISSISSRLPVLRSPRYRECKSGVNVSQKLEWTISGTWSESCRDLRLFANAAADEDEAEPCGSDSVSIAGNLLVIDLRGAAARGNCDGDRGNCCGCGGPVRVVSELPST
jgi:hypothetical protein